MKFEVICQYKYKIRIKTFIYSIKRFFCHVAFFSVSAPKFLDNLVTTNVWPLGLQYFALSTDLDLLLVHDNTEVVLTAQALSSKKIHFRFRLQKKRQLYMFIVI